MILRRDLRDLIAPAAVLRIAKAGMVRIQLHNGVSIRDGSVQISGDDSGINVIRED
jgi:hypothetical protein